jgi:hypothetical protein
MNFTHTLQPSKHTLWPQCFVQVQWTCSSKLQNCLDQQLDAGNTRTAITEHSYNDLFKLPSPTKFVQQHLGRKWKRERKKHRIVWSTAAARADGWLMMTLAALCAAIWQSSPQQTVAAPNENSCWNGSQQLDVFSFLQVDKQRRFRIRHRC